MDKRNRKGDEAVMESEVSNKRYPGFGYRSKYPLDAGREMGRENEAGGCVACGEGTVN